MGEITNKKEFVKMMIDQKAPVYTVAGLGKLSKYMGAQFPSKNNAEFIPTFYICKCQVVINENNIEIKKDKIKNEEVFRYSIDNDKLYIGVNRYWKEFKDFDNMFDDEDSADEFIKDFEEKHLYDNKTHIQDLIDQLNGEIKELEGLIETRKEMLNRLNEQLKNAD